MQPPPSHPSIERCADVISAWIATNLCAFDGSLPIAPALRPGRRSLDRPRAPLETGVRTAGR
jgi:hypothetical protein